jgi:hypothetical protein
MKVLWVILLVLISTALALSGDTIVTHQAAVNIDSGITMTWDTTPGRCLPHFADSSIHGWPPEVSIDIETLLDNLIQQHAFEGLQMKVVDGIPRSDWPKKAISYTIWCSSGECDTIWNYSGDIVHYSDAGGICDTSGIAWREKTEHLYSPGEPRPVSFSVECTTVDSVVTYINGAIDLETGDTLALWDDDSVITKTVCDTTWNYPVEYEAVIFCDTTQWREYFWDWVQHGDAMIEEKVYLKEGQDVNREIFREPILHCDTLYRRKP